MATIAVFRFPSDTLVLGALFEAHPAATVEIEGVIPTGTAMTPYFWVDGVSERQVRDSLDSETGVNGVEIVDTFEGRALLRCNCQNGHNKLFDIVAACDVSLLAAEGTADGWTLTFRGNEAGALARFDEASREAGLSLELCDLHDTARPITEDATVLTQPQREALRLAYENGYYETPRETTLAEIAGELDISRQALANRLARGYRSLIRTYVLAEST